MRFLLSAFSAAAMAFAFISCRGEGSDWPTGWNALTVVGLLLGVGLLYSLSRFIGDLRRRDIRPPRLYDGISAFGRYARIEPLRWDKAQILKGLVVLITGAVIIALIAKYYPELIPDDPHR